LQGATYLDAKHDAADGLADEVLPVTPQILRNKIKCLKLEFKTE